MPILGIGLLLGTVAATSPLCPAEEPRGHSLSEIREMRQVVETKHNQRMREIQDGLTVQSYDSDTALMLRMKADQEYKSRMQSLQIEEEQAYRALEAQQPHPRNDESRVPSAAIPRIPSQSVITYPAGGDPDAPQPQEKPQKEGRQKNVGFGTRELEF